MKPLKFRAYRTNLLMKLLNKSLIVDTTSTNPKYRNWLVLPAFSALLSVMMVTTAVAQSDKEDGSDRKTKETVAMSQPVYEALTEIQALVEAEDYAGAMAAINDLQNGKKEVVSL